MACSCESCLGKVCGRIWRVWGPANGRLGRPQKQMAVACSCESCLRKACGRVWRAWGPANGRLERFQKQMAVACSCESCLGKACGRVWWVWGPSVFGRLERSNNKCLWPECLVEAAAMDFRGFWWFLWFEGWQTAGLNALRTEGYGGKRQAWTL